VTGVQTCALPISRSGLSGAVGTDNAGVGSRSGGVPPSAHGRATSNTATTARATAVAAPNIPARARLLDPPTTATPPTLQRLFPPLGLPPRPRLTSRPGRLAKGLVHGA